MSVTEILDWIDPTTLEQEIRSLLTLLGPYLAHGLTYREIAPLVECSEEWVSDRVGEIRLALVRAALARSDRMSAQLRARLEGLQSRSDVS